MAVTETSICNSALVKCGAQRILSLTENNERARLVKEQFEKKKDELLFAHPWKFATGRVELAPSITNPISGFDKQFPLPTNVLRVYDTDLSKDTPWRVEGRMLLTNSESVKITYIRNDIPTSEYPPTFAEALATSIAADIAYSLTQNAALKATLKAEFKEALREARSFNGQEANGDRVYADSWLNARF